MRGRSLLARLAAPTATALLVAALLVVPDQPLMQPRADATSTSMAHPMVERGSPTVTSFTRGRVDVFWRSSSGTLVHRYRPAGGSWTRALGLGGSLASRPAAVSWAAGRIDVFARGTDGQLRQRTLTVDGWGRWRSLGGSLTSAPSVAVQRQGALTVFARGPGRTIVHRSYVRGSGWGSWHSLDGVVTSSPAAVSWEPDRIDLLARGPDGTLVHRRHTPSTGWSRWRSHGGVLHSQPAVAAPAPGHLDVLYRGRDGTIRLQRRIPGAGFGTPRSLAVSGSVGPAAVAVGDAVRVVTRDGNRWRTAVRRAPTSGWSRWAPIDVLAPVRGLATWVDVYDYGLDPERSVADMRARGVRVLYLATARFSSPRVFHDRALMGRWLDAAHGAGITVVGWYVPGYGNLGRDVRRTVAIERYVSPGGNRFDAVGINIERFRNPGQPVGEYTGEVLKKDFDRRLVAHLRRTRTRIRSMTVAIVPTPYATAPGNRWEGFPWSAVGRDSDVTVPMVLWSFRDDLSADQVRDHVARQIERTRTLSGDPVHVEGGVDEPALDERTPVTTSRVRAFVTGALAGGAVGGGHYDYATTDPVLWSILTRLNGR